MFPVEQVEVIQASYAPLEVQARLFLFFDTQELIIESCRSVEWTSSALGFPEKGKKYLCVMVPGYELVVWTPEGRFFVHTNCDGTQIAYLIEGTHEEAPPYHCYPPRG
jgi:hypothetical protein